MQPIYSISTLAAIILLAGCATQPSTPYAEFVRSVDFTHFDSARVRVAESDDLQSVLSADAHSSVLAATLASVVDALQAKNFVLVEDAAESVDLLVSASWHELQRPREAPSTPIIHAHLSDPDRPIQEPMPSPRQGFQLVIEVADARSGNVFWRAASSRSQSLLAPDADRAASLAARLTETFPRRLEKDPNLPHITMP